MPVRSHIGRLSLAALAIALAAALVFPVFRNSLDADDLRTEWNFEGEDALDGWVLPDIMNLAPGEGVGGSQAAGITVDTIQLRATIEVVYPLLIQPGALYQFGGEYVSADGDIDWVRLAIVYRDANGDFLEAAEDHRISPGSWQSEPPPAPCDAVQGQLRLLAYGEAGATAYIDDLFVKESAPATPCPAPIPTTTSTHTPSATATASATASPTATPTDTALPSTAPPSTNTPAPTSTRTDTPTAVATASPVSPELRFANGGFEDGAGGEPATWETIGGLLMQSGSPVRGGSWSGAFFSSTTSTKWAYQTVSVEPANWYTFGAFVYHDDPWVESAALRISWYASIDGTGSALATVDSTASLAPPEPGFRPLTTGPVMAPPGVHSARLRVLMRPVDETNAVIYIDDVSFVKADAPLPPTTTQTSPPQTTSTVAATTSPKNTPAGSTPTSTPQPASALPPTSTDTPLPTPTAASPTTAPPSSTLAQEDAPLRLTNAGFEIEEDGAPAGWRTFGGLLTQTNTPVRSGAGAGAFFSSSSSTKWLYQTVAIRPQAWYQLDAFVHHSHAWVESVLLRISWYGSDDGSGSAMLSVDSTASLDLPTPGYRRLTTGPVQAPPGARSAKLRILLRPRDGTSALIYIDDVSFDRATAPAFVEEAATVSAATAASGRTSQVLSLFAPVPATATNQQPSYTPMPAPVIRRHTLQTPDQLATPRERDAIWPWALLGATVGAGAVGWGAYWAVRRRADAL